MFVPFQKKQPWFLGYDRDVENLFMHPYQKKELLKN